MKILVVGGSGGIGLSVVKQMLQSHPSAEIIATFHSRQVDFQDARLEWRKLNIKDESAIAELSEKLGKLDILINAIGILHADGRMPEKSIKQFERDFFLHNVELNTLPSILLAKHFMNALNSESSSYFVVLSARIGSISDNHLGGWLSYRVTKAAVNMAMKTLAIEWQKKLPNCCVLIFHPGTTDTDFSKPFQKRLPKGQLHSPEETANALLRLIKNSSPKDTGRFVSFDGSEITW